jgi:hypothetical protein
MATNRNMKKVRIGNVGLVCGFPATSLTLQAVILVEWGAQRSIEEFFENSRYLLQRQTFSQAPEINGFSGAPHAIDSTS